MLCEVSADRSGARSRIAAVLCFVACLLSTPTLLLMLVVALGAIDRQHHAAVEERGGRLTVVLHHDAHCQPMDHDHELPARLLAVLAQPGDEHSDHVVALPHASVADDQQTATSSRESVGDGQAPQPSLHTTHPFLISSAASAIPPRPRPTCDFTLACLRSTTLRI